VPSPLEINVTGQNLVGVSTWYVARLCSPDDWIDVDRSSSERAGQVKSLRQQTRQLRPRWVQGRSKLVWPQAFARSLGRTVFCRLRVRRTNGFAAVELATATAANPWGRIRLAGFFACVAAHVGWRFPSNATARQVSPELGMQETSRSTIYRPSRWALRTHSQQPRVWMLPRYPRR